MQEEVNSLVEISDADPVNARTRESTCLCARGGDATMDDVNGTEARICLLPEDLEVLEDPRTPSLRRISYGIILPAICCLGIVGNILNLVVLTRRNMRGTAYIYMRGKLLLAKSKDDSSWAGGPESGMQRGRYRC